jgi:hypothetical protein
MIYFLDMADDWEDISNDIDWILSRDLPIRVHVCLFCLSRVFIHVRQHLHHVMSELSLNFRRNSEQILDTCRSLRVDRRVRSYVDRNRSMLEH